MLAWLAPGPVEERPGGRARFGAQLPSGARLTVGCNYNAVLRADPGRCRIAPRACSPVPDAAGAGAGSGSLSPSGFAPSLSLIAPEASQTVVVGEDAQPRAAAGEGPARWLWVQSLASLGREAQLGGDLELLAAVERALGVMQQVGGSWDRTGAGMQMRGLLGSGVWTSRPGSSSSSIA